MVFILFLSVVIVVVRVLEMLSVLFCLLINVVRLFLVIVKFCLIVVEVLENWVLILFVVDVKDLMIIWVVICFLVVIFWSLFFVIFRYLVIVLSILGVCLVIELNLLFCNVFEVKFWFNWMIVVFVVVVLVLLSVKDWLIVFIMFISFWLVLINECVLCCKVVYKLMDDVNLVLVLLVICSSVFCVIFSVFVFLEMFCSLFFISVVWLV